MGSKVAQLLGSLAPVAAAFIPGIGPLASAAIGAGGGLLSGGGLKSALLGGITGGAGNYLGNGGFSQLFPETSNAFNSATGGLIGSATGTAPTPGSFSNLFSGGGSSSYVPTDPGDANLLKNAQSALTPAGGFGMNQVAALGGAANSLYANSQAQSALKNSQNSALNTLQPYLQGGGASNAHLMDLLGLSGNTSAEGYGTLGKTFQPGDLTKTPGYQFQLEQGNKALGQQQAAKGNYFSGGALKAAQDYGQGLAENTYNNAFNQWQQEQNQIYNQYAGQSAQGANAANAAGNIFGNIGSAQANAGINSANITNQTLSSLLGGSGAYGKQPKYDQNGNFIGYYA